MFKRRKMRLNGEWSLLAGNRVYELTLNKAHANPPIIGNTVFVLHFYLIQISKPLITL